MAQIYFMLWGNYLLKTTSRNFIHKLGYDYDQALGVKCTTSCWQ